MKKFSLCFLAALLVAPACGGDDSGDPDAHVNPPADARITIDAPDSPDAMNPADAAIPDATPPLVGIADARGAADGTVDVSIPNVYVTYTKPAIGTDLAGFFVQEVQTGPALFIAVDPTTLTPVPAVGDEVSFTITQMATAGMLRQATAITDLVVDSSSNDLSGLVQDVSAAADLVSAVGNYESELIEGSFTITQAFASAGTGHVAAVVETTAVTADTNLRLRLPATLQDVLGLEVTCAVTVSDVPMWRYNSAAQVSAWNQAEVAATCPAPTVVSATSTSDTEVDVVFSRGISAAVAGNFTITGGAGLAVSAAAIDGATVTLTTGAQSAGQAYTVTVANTVLDIFGVGIGTPADANFNGFGTPELICNDGLDDDTDGYVDCQDANCSADAACGFLEQLYLWEIDSDTPDTDAAEFIEVRNLSSSSIGDLSSYFLLFVNGNGDVPYLTIALTGALEAGGILVVGNPGVSGVDITFDPGASGALQNGPDGVLLVHCPTCTGGASDIPNGTALGTDPTFTVTAGTVTKIDGIAYDTDDADDTGLMAAIGVTTQYNEDEHNLSATESNQRTSLTGWTARTATPDATGVEP